MPVQKGKRRKRPRNRAGSTDSPRPVIATPSHEPSGKRGSRPVARQRWQPPLWVNVIVGLGMLALGAVFTFVIPQKGMTTNVRLALFAGYCVISAFYLSKAYRQYRAGQGD